MEIWKQLRYGSESYEKYEVSTYGRIRNSQTLHIKKTQVDYRGYEVATIYRNNDDPNKKLKSIKIHRAVASTFLENFDYSLTVNHKDGNKLNNMLSNLEWCSQKENNQHSASVLGYSEMFSKNAKRTFSKKVLQLDKNENLINEWESTREAERQLGFKHENISKCARGERKQYHGYLWRYVENVV